MPDFPDVPTDLTVELDIGGTWTGITSYVMGRDPVSIKRGRSDDANGTEPSQMRLTFNNRDGRFSPRNPMSPYFASLGRNTPTRAYVNRGPLGLLLPGDSGDEATTPDSAGLSITGDIDVRIDLTTSNWSKVNLCGKWKTTGNQMSWALQTRTDGTLSFAWTTGGSIATAALAASTLPVPLYPGRLAIRVTLDVNNGASGNTATFYTSDSIDGTWTQLGDAVTAAGTTSIFDSTAVVEVGDLTEQTTVVGISAQATSPVRGRVHALELYSGIGGTVKASPDFTAQTAGATSFADAQTNTWTMAGNSDISDLRWRFHGEVSELPSRWDISGRDVWVPAVAGGLMRRLGQGSTPLRSTIYRGVLSEALVVAYWPCEDGSDAKSIAPYTAAGGVPMIVTGSPSMAASDVFAASESLPTVGASSWSGQVNNYLASSQAQIRHLLEIPTAGIANNTTVMRIYTSGTVARWDIIYTTASSGGFSVNAFDDENNTLYSGGSAITGYNGNPVRLSLELEQNGTDVDLALWALRVGDGTAVGLLHTITSVQFGKVKSIVVNPSAVDTGDTTLGHISVHPLITPLDDLLDELNGYVAETAGNRIARLCTEESIEFRSIGDLDASAAMGVQQPGTLLDLFTECADADLGILYEPRDVVGIGYRTRESLYNQVAQVQIDYSAGELSDTPEPTDDDQRIENDVTATRTGGSSARYEVTDGPLSVSDPPDGAGRYETQDTINIAQDGLLPDQAQWRAHLGTVDEARYPQLSVAYHSNELQANAELVRQLLESEIGDRISVANPPAWLPQQSIEQILQGSTETFTNFLHDAVLNATPESPYEIAVCALDPADTAGSSLAAASDEVAFVASAATLNSAASDNVVVSKPAGTLQGHVMVARIGLIGQVTISAPAGWTLIGTEDAGTAVRYAAYYKVAGASEPSSYTWTWTNPFKNSGSIGTYSGVDTSTPVADSAGTGANVSGTTVTTTAVDVPDGGMLSVGVFERHTATGAANTWTDAADTERLDHGTNAGTGQDISHAVYTSAAQTAQSSISRTLTASQTVTLVATWAIALNPATTILSVATTLGPLWTTDSSSMPFDVNLGGEQVTVTAISGSSSPQAFTVTRSVNGISKTHDAGTDVRLWAPRYREM